MQLSLWDARGLQQSSNYEYLPVITGLHTVGILRGFLIYPGKIMNTIFKLSYREIMSLFVWHDWGKPRETWG
jgi:hypothetical protein